jgi:hypothetical protein
MEKEQKSKMYIYNFGVDKFFIRNRFGSQILFLPFWISKFLKDLDGEMTKT